MKASEIIALALEAGFTAAVPMDVTKLEFMPPVREMCAADKCLAYNKSWSCPPACGTLEELREKCSKYKNGLLVQTMYSMEDEYDIEKMFGAESGHAANFNKLTKTLAKIGLDMLPMGAGSCRLCESCTYPDRPCRFPDLVFPSMEACGLLVSKVCSDNNLPYYYGANTIAYCSCYLYC